METDVTMDLLQSHNNLNRNITMDTAVWYMSERFLGQLCERTWRARDSVVWESFEGQLCRGNSERSTWVYTESGDRLWCEWTARKSIVGASELQLNDGIYAEVLLWCASEPIARRWIVPTCVWKLSDRKNGSECWKIATRFPVGRIL
jgi:hypothetical protein